MKITAHPREDIQLRVTNIGLTTNGQPLPAMEINYASCKLGLVALRFHRYPSPNAGPPFAPSRPRFKGTHVLRTLS